MELQTTKNKNHKSTKEKTQILFKSTTVRLRADFSKPTMETRKQCNNNFSGKNPSNYPPRITHPTNPSFENERLNF